MAINPNLLVIKPVNELESVTGLQAGQILFYDGSNNLKKIDVDTFNNLSKTAKPLKPTDATPTVEGLYIPTESGTYSNAGGLVAQEGYYTLFFFDGTNWTKSETKLPENSVNIPLWEDFIQNPSNFPATRPTQVIKDNVQYVVAEGASVNVSDIPGESDKWVALSEKVTQKNEIATDILVANATGSNFNTSTFSGFGFSYGVVKNFNRITLPIWQRASTTDEVTKVYLRVRETDYQGTLLFDGVKDVTIPQGTSQDVTFDMPLIENTTDKVIWVEFVCDGLTRLNNSTSLPLQNYRYKTTAQGITPFSTNSSAAGSPANPIAIKFQNITQEIVLIPTLSVDNLEIGNMNPIKSDAVAKEFEKYNNVIVDGFEASTTVIKGNSTVNSATSTFTGWGQLLEGLSNFNRVGYIFRAFSNVAIPNKVRCVIRKSTFNGEIIFDQTKDVTLLLNVDKKVYFNLPDVYENLNNDDLFISFFANGRIALIGGSATSDFALAYRVRYSTSSLSNITTETTTNAKYQLYVEVLNGQVVKQISDNEIERIAIELGGFENPDLILTSKVYTYPTAQYNIFNKNVCVPKYGDNLSNFRLDFGGSLGKQTNRGFRLDSVPPSTNSTISLSLAKGRHVLVSKTQNILSGALTSGSGNTRQVLIIGDSTAANSNISTPLKNVFDSDAMNINLIGTLGSAGVKHEGRGGWTINNYYGIGVTLYAINVTGITTAPGIGSRYTQGSNTYNVEEVNISGGTGYFSVSIVSGTAPTSSGVLIKSIGTGDNSITYASSSITSGNPFYDSSVGKFNIGYYLTNTGQSLSDNDWIFFQLGINDVFSLSDINGAITRTNTMITQLNDMVTNVHAYNANIRIGLIVTFPPADQNAFGESYSTGQLSEMYIKTGLITWQKKLIETFDNTASETSKVYLVSAHLNLDTENNYPTITRTVNSRNSNTEIVQSNGVHPASSGYAQIADMYAGLIKYFG